MIGFNGPGGMRLLLRRAWPYLRRWRWRAAAAMAAALAASALASLAPVLQMRAVDAASAGSASALLIALGLLGGVLGATVLLHAWEEVWSTDVEVGLDEDLHGAVVRRLYELPPQWHQLYTPTETVEQLEASVERFAQSGGTLLFQLVPTVLYVLVSVGVLWSLDWRLAIVVGVSAPLPVLVQRIALTEGTRREAAEINGFARVYARLMTTLERLATVQACGRESHEVGRFLAGIYRVHRLIRLGCRRDAQISALAELAEHVALFGVLGVGGWLVLNHHITLGAVVAALAYLEGFFGPVQALGGMAREFLANRIALFHVWKLVDEPDPHADLADATPAPRLSGEIRFEDVTVRSRDGRVVLDRLGFATAPGEVVALVGESGSGKSTVLRALQRLERVTSGRVLLDGFDIARVTRGSLRRQLGVVAQEIELFADSVLENIRYSQPGASNEEVVAAATAAAADRFIRRLPSGYHTRIANDGRNLSGGQRQRLVLARALLRDAPILLLDEATSDLDRRTERHISRALLGLRGARTILVAAHHLETILAADRVVFLHEGRLQAVGTHEQLLATSPLYRT
ncbi:MAG TPA: ABC transporter ATP-binding protein, partial [Gemmatimonadales bacterium]|nr:ABC transporter ATP-binding protein [Gemmatimonadales bacterium]